MTAEVWHGAFCYKKSTMEDEKTFPLSHEGLEAMRTWLLEHSKEDTE